MAEPPLPPVDLMRRVGVPRDDVDTAGFYVGIGKRWRDALDQLSPEGWEWEGRRALDFGCGAGRTLRHLLGEAERAELWGCDIDGASIRWLEQNLSPPLRVFQVADRPPLPQPDGYFDAIWGFSVFTHIDRNWAEWLLELRRVLADDGWILLTILSEGARQLWEIVARDEPWDDDRVGMAALWPGNKWAHGGPMVFHSEWWIRSRWSRAFEIERLERRGFSQPGGAADPLLPRAGEDFGYVLLRKKPGELGVEDLRRPDPGEPREAIAALAQLARLQAELDEVVGSRSWRMTQALRDAGRAVRRLSRARSGGPT